MSDYYHNTMRMLLNTNEIAKGAPKQEDILNKMKPIEWNLPAPVRSSYIPNEFQMARQAPKPSAPSERLPMYMKPTMANVSNQNMSMFQEQFRPKPTVANLSVAKPSNQNIPMFLQEDFDLISNKPASVSPVFIPNEFQSGRTKSMNLPPPSRPVSDYAVPSAPGEGGKRRPRIQSKYVPSLRSEDDSNYRSPRMKPKWAAEPVEKPSYAQEENEDDLPIPHFSKLSLSPKKQSVFYPKKEDPFVFVPTRPEPKEEPFVFVPKRLQYPIDSSKQERSSPSVSEENRMLAILHDVHNKANFIPDDEEEGKKIRRVYDILLEAYNQYKSVPYEQRDYVFEMFMRNYRML